VLDGVNTTVKVAHVRLCHSRMPFVRAYPRKTQEMVFDVHERAFALFRGACTRGIYDNMKTMVETVFIGRDRLFNRRFVWPGARRCRQACTTAPPPRHWTSSATSTSPTSRPSNPRGASAETEPPLPADAPDPAHQQAAVCPQTRSTFPADTRSTLDAD